MLVYVFLKLNISFYLINDLYVYCIKYWIIRVILKFKDILWLKKIKRNENKIGKIIMKNE